MRVICNCGSHKFFVDQTKTHLFFSCVFCHTIYREDWDTGIGFADALSWAADKKGDGETIAPEDPELIAGLKALVKRL